MTKSADARARLHDAAVQVENAAFELARDLSSEQAGRLISIARELFQLADGPGR